MATVKFETAPIEISSNGVDQIRKHLEIQGRRVEANKTSKVERAHMLGMMEVATLAGIDTGKYHWVFLI